MVKVYQIVVFRSHFFGAENMPTFREIFLDAGLLCDRRLIIVLQYKK